MVVGGKVDSDVLELIAQRLALPAEMAQALTHALDRLCQARRTDLTDHEAAWLEELHSTTWFALDHSPLLVQTRTGTRPGDPLARPGQAWPGLAIPWPSLASP